MHIELTPHSSASVQTFPPRLPQINVNLFCQAQTLVHPAPTIFYSRRSQFLLFTGTPHPNPIGSTPQMASDALDANERDIVLTSDIATLLNTGGSSKTLQPPQPQKTCPYPMNISTMSSPVPLNRSWPYKLANSGSMVN